MATTAVAAAVIAVSACAAAAAPGPYHDPDHARGALPSATARDTELAFLRQHLDAMYAHRAGKLRTYRLDEAALFADARAELQAATTWAAYDEAMYALLARFRDGHLTYKPPSTAAPQRGYTSFSLGFSTVLGGRRVLVASVEPGSDAAAAGVRPGDEVLAIDGRAAADVLADAGRSRAVSRPESAMTTFARTWTTVLYPKGDPPRHRAIRIGTRDGRTLDVAITPVEVPARRHEPVSTDIAGGVAVVTIRSLEGAKRGAQIDDALAHARTAPAIAIDLRGDRGGVDLVGQRVLADLAGGTAQLGTYRVLVTPETLARRPLWKALTAEPDGFSPPQPITVKALDHGYPGKVAVVVDAACASTCETVTAALRADVHALVVGDVTGGSSGAPVSIELPVSHATVGIPTWILTSAEGQPIEDIGVTPDLDVEPTADALAHGQDLPLATAISKLAP